MAISLKHKFASAKADSGDATLVRPSNWNDEHDITLATAKLIGRYTAGTGAAQEVGLSADLTFTAGNLALSTAAAAAVADVVNKAPLASPALTGTPTAPTQAVTEDNTRIATMAAVHDVVAYSMPGYLYGLTLSNNVSDPNNDIDIATGVCCATQANPVMMRLASALTKRLDANWVVGNNQGFLDTGAIADGTYHIFIIHRPDTGVTDVLASLSPTSPTLPANYTMSRRIASIVRLTSIIIRFSQNGDEFLMSDPFLDISATQNTAATSRALTVPTGIRVDALIRVRGDNAAVWGMVFISPDTPSILPTNTSGALCDLAGGAGQSDRATLKVRTDTTGSILTRSTAASTDLKISAYGWIDRRDQ